MNSFPPEDWSVTVLLPPKVSSYGGLQVLQPRGYFLPPYSGELAFTFGWTEELSIEHCVNFFGIPLKALQDPKCRTVIMLSGIQGRYMITLYSPARNSLYAFTHTSGKD